MTEQHPSIMEHPVFSWRQFCELIIDGLILNAKGNQNNTNKKKKTSKKLTLNDYVWRGHRRSSWDIVSSFDRIRKWGNSRENMSRRHLNSFVYACRGKLAEFDIQIKDWKRDIRENIIGLNHIWSLGQHYFLKTPLLDWCYSPFVAAFFAFEEESRSEDFAEDDWQQIKEVLNEVDSKDKLINKMKDKAEDRAIIGLNIQKLKKLRSKELQIRLHSRRDDCNENEHKRESDFVYTTHKRKDDKGGKPHIRKDDNLPSLYYFDPMSSEHSRLTNQRGLFTITKTGECIEDIAKRNWKNGDDPWIIKIMIPNNKRQEFLWGLNLMNINHMSLFPEITGAAKFCNIGIEEGMDGYSVFHGQGPE